jgi:hypothetical protein
MATKHPEIVVRLASPANDFSIVDHVAKALRNAGISNSEIDKFCDEVLASEENEQPALRLRLGDQRPQD